MVAHVEPVEFALIERQSVRRRELVASGAYRFHPLAERQLQFPVHEIAHVDGPIRYVILDVVQFVDEFAAVRLRHAREPALVPGRDRIAKGCVSLLPDLLRQLESTINGFERFFRLLLAGRFLGVFEKVADAADVRKHREILPV